MKLNACIIYTGFLWHLFIYLALINNDGLLFNDFTFTNRVVTASVYLSSTGRVFFSFCLYKSGVSVMVTNIAQAQGPKTTKVYFSPSQVSRGVATRHHVMSSFRDTDSKRPATENFAGHHARRYAMYGVLHWLLRFSLKCDT